MAGKLTPSQRAYIRKRTKVHTPGPDELDDELNIVPFLDIVINLIMFLLILLTTVGFYTQVSAELPTFGGGRGVAPDEPPLNLSLFITDQGIIVTGSAGKLAPGCERTQTGDVISVPMAGNDYDWAGLRTCVARVKQEFENENQITVSADNLIQYQHVLAAMDAVRETDGGEPLFNDVRISAGVR